MEKRGKKPTHELVKPHINNTHHCSLLSLVNIDIEVRIPAVYWMLMVVSDKGGGASGVIISLGLVFFVFLFFYPSHLMGLSHKIKIRNIIFWRKRGKIMAL